MEKDAIASTLVELIASRKLLVSSRGPLWYIFPGIKQKLYAQYVYNKRLKEAKAEGVPSSDESLKNHIKLGLWDDLKEKNLGLIPKFIEETEDKIKKEKNKLSKEKYEKWLRVLQREFMLLLNIRNTILLNSAEYLAHESCSHFLMWECLRNYDDSRLWSKFEDIENSTDVDYITELLNLLADASKELSIKDVRQLAKDNSWRVRWRAVEGDFSHLFGRSAQDLTNDQFLLTYWSGVYDSVYENFERPPDEIINDDDKLDEWLKEQSEKRQREIGQKFYGKSDSKTPNSKIDEASEVYKVIEGRFNEKGEFVKFSEDERWQEIERIRKLNSPQARAIKQREEKQLAKTPGVFVQEHELRKNKLDREAMGGTVKYEGKR